MGPLSGVKVIEVAGIGPGPFCAMVLSDLGASVVRVDRRSEKGSGLSSSVLNRGRRSIAVDLKHARGVELVLRLVEGADALIEGFRPGVMERLGLGPDVCWTRNERLVYGRMTGWGQSGPLAQAAGHDINYISLSGVLHSIGRPDSGPVPPLNLVGDFGGGGMLLALGVVAALFESQKSGRGQVVDCAMTEGSALLMAAIYGMRGAGMWTNDRGSNVLDTGAHFYDAYECADGKWISVGSIEPQFYSLLREKAGLAEHDFDNQWDRARWPLLKEKLRAVFKTKSRDEWCRIMEGSDVCFAPVLDLDEAPRHAHNAARSSFVEVAGVVQPAAAPRFSRTEVSVQGPPPKAGEHTDEVLAELGLAAAEIAALRDAGAI
jgi:alpha-methylacyl-CoA racemase